MTIKNKKMTSKTKTILFASLIAAILIPMSGMSFAIGEQPKNLNIVRENVEFVPSAELQRVDVLVKSISQPNNFTQAEIDNTKAQIGTLIKIIESKTMFNLSDEKRSFLYEKYELLNQQLDKDPNFKRLLETEVVGFGIDEAEQGILVTVQSDFAKDENYERYFGVFRAIVGNDIPIVIEQTERGYPTACSSRTSDCDPLRGGIKIESESFNPCSLGFKATFNGVEGFVMAGHCTSNSKKIYQPVEDFFQVNRVGVVTYTAWDSDTRCDCAFVDIDTGITIVDDAYLTLDLDTVGTVASGTVVTMSGYNGVTTTTVNTAVYTTTINGNTLREHIKLNAPSVAGDSGGPVYDSVTKKLFAIQSHVEAGKAIVSNANKLGIEIAGASWNFT